MSPDPADATILSARSVAFWHRRGLISLKRQARLFARVRLGLLGVLLIGVVAFWSVGYRPNQARLRELADATERRREELDESRVQSRALPGVKRQVDELTARLAESKPLPQRQMLAEFIGEVTRLKEQTRLAAFDTNYHDLRRRDMFTEQPIDLKFRGDYTDVREFLRRLDALDRLTRVRRLSIKAIELGNGQVAVEMTVNIYFTEG